jgi:transposase
MKTLRIDYQGKIIYLGIDVHKSTYSVTVICDGLIVKRDTIAASPVGLVTYLKRCFAGARIRSAYEAGFSGFTLHRILVQNGVENIVINPASIEVAANDKVKTDRRDSRKLAEQLCAGRLQAIFIPEPEQELRRQLTRTREQIVRQRSRLANQIKSKLHYFGVRAGDGLLDRVINERSLRQIERLNLGEELAFALRLLSAQWRFLTLQLTELQQKLRAQARDDAALESTYRSAPGIGLIGARVLANELGNPARRFHNERELFKFTGLTPTEHSSGESVRRGHISRQGAARIRALLVEAAWEAVRADPALRFAFELAARCGKKRAIVAMARKLIGRIRACFKAGTLYECMPAVFTELA